MIIVTCLLLTQSHVSAHRTPATATAVRNFVKGLYDWYAPMADDNFKSPAEADPVIVALKTRGSSFTGKLRKTHKAKKDTQKNTETELVRIDIDPFLRSQD